MITTPEVSTPALGPAERLREIIRERGVPTTVAELVKELKLLKVKKPEVEALLGVAVERGELFVCNGSRKNAYWHTNPTQEVESLVGRILNLDPLIEKDIVARVKKELGTRIGDAGIKQVLAAMRESGRLHFHPGKGKQVRLGILPAPKPDPFGKINFDKTAANLWKEFIKGQKEGGTLAEFIQRLVLALEQKHEQAQKPVEPMAPVADSPVMGLIPTPEPLMTAPAAPEPPPLPATDTELMNLVLKAMAEVGAGIPVPVADLRQQMPSEYRDKSRFDSAVWSLVEKGQLFLNRHNFPASLTPQERENLLTDPQGEIYGFVIQPFA
ncbi:MAG: hypothetical protein U0840_29795 [Gemmataceae bacterium]